MNLDKITQQYLELFPGDLSMNPVQRQTPGVLYALVNPVGFDNPELILFNEKLSNEIGLGNIENDKDRSFLNANDLPDNLKPYATAYAGHQFGNWAGQLGDGRAIFIGEIENSEGKKTELQWKGAGATPYSRHADGRAVLRSTVREYLMSEAIHHLKIPTSRALSMSFTGENVVRDIMYNGNPKAEKGAVMMRTAESFLRFGHFELVSAQKNFTLLKQLADFTIENYFPKIKSEGKQKYADWFRLVSEKTADMIVEWFRVGFVHGVMNTDNMSILGLTIDYGPFSMMDEYDLNFTSNTTDLPGRRYAFGEQGKIAQWNIWQLANALYPLFEEDTAPLQQVLDDFGDYFWKKHDEMLCHKFGFDSLKPEDEKFFTDWQMLMQDMKIDYTLFFSKLENWKSGFNLKEHFGDIFYKTNSEENYQKLNGWLSNYTQRLSLNSISEKESKQLMQENNPKFILRNYLLFECIEELNNGKTTLLNKLIHALENPYTEIFPEFSVKRPAKYDEVPGCSILSCSS